MRFNIRVLLVLFSLVMFWVSCDNRPSGDDEPDTPQTITTDSDNPDQPTVSISSFLGTFNMTCIETYNRTNEQWNVKISYTSARRNNGRTWVVISGLYYGKDFMNAYGYYDPDNKCIRIPANIPDNENTFYFTDDPNQTDYYAVFTPCLLTDDWSSFYYTQDDTDEMWLRVESNGQLRLGAAGGSSIEEGTFYDSYTFFYFYESTGKAPEDNYFYVFSNAVFTRTSYYSAPSQQKQRDMKKPNPAMLLRGQDVKALVVSR